MLYDSMFWDQTKPCVSLVTFWLWMLGHTTCHLMQFYFSSSVKCYVWFPVSYQSHSLWIQPWITVSLSSASLFSLFTDVKFEIDLPKKLVWIESDKDVDELMNTLKKCGKEVKYNGTKWRNVIHVEQVTCDWQYSLFFSILLLLM